jgi:hypothetical protein
MLDARYWILDSHHRTLNIQHPESRIDNIETINLGIATIDKKEDNGELRKQSRSDLCIDGGFDGPG